MSFQGVERGITLPTDVEIPQGRFVTVVSGDVGVSLPTSGIAGDPVGVSLEATQTSATIPVYAAGDVTSFATYNGAIVEVEASEAIAFGAKVSCADDGSGKAQTAEALDILAGYAMSAVGADGEFVDVLLIKEGAVV